MAHTGYSRSPKLLKGALIQFSAPMLIPIPNIIIFQYNPETMSRTLHAVGARPSATVEATTTARASSARPDRAAGHALAQPYDPQETFSLALELDADRRAGRTRSRTRSRWLTGVADRLAALRDAAVPAGRERSWAGCSLNVSGSASSLGRRRPARRR